MSLVCLSSNEILSLVKSTILSRVLGLGQQRKILEPNMFKSIVKNTPQG
jgi:hypothetical protein